MVELTKLPEKWCVEITEENKDILTKWKQTIGNKEIAGAYDSYYVNMYGLNCLTAYDPVISFEQFKKWVLKDLPEFPGF